MSIANKEGNPQKLLKNKKPDSVNMHNKLNECESNTNPSNPDNLCKDIVKSVVDKNAFEKNFDHTEEKMRNISYIHRDMQMKLLKNKKETFES